MLDMTPTTSKQQILVALVHQLVHGRALLERPISNQTELSGANFARSTWALKTKKLLHALIGDYGGLSHFHQSRGNHELGLNPTIHQEVEHFRHAVGDQLAFLEKLIRHLQRLA